MCTDPDYGDTHTKLKTHPHARAHTHIIYTINLLISVGVRKLQVAILARSSRLTVHPVMSSCLSSA